ncbi:uncharacterized protein LOC143037308 [Oratosquilla oratoria]|uniref:uncharacterized protein LOC143037308 n=1 Tax=Oratosquilla oratoria TaxID=337810 RepID=UPI003F7616C7
MAHGHGNKGISASSVNKPVPRAPQSDSLPVFRSGNPTTCGSVYTTSSLRLTPFYDGQRQRVCRYHLFYGNSARTCKMWCILSSKCDKVFPSSSPNSRLNSRSPSPGSQLNMSGNSMGRIIRRSNSPWASPLYLVHKKEPHSWRPCRDYRGLNNIPVAEQDIPKTAICAPFGFFEFLYMPFGLKNARATFQHFIDTLLANVNNTFTYFDDVPIAYFTGFMLFHGTPIDGQLPYFLITNLSLLPFTLNLLLKLTDNNDNSPSFLNVSSVEYIHGDNNAVANCLSCTLCAVSLNVFDLSGIAQSQATDDKLETFKPRLLKFALPSDLTLWCDTSTKIPRPFVPLPLRNDVVSSLHNLSHPGVQSTSKLVKQRYFWPYIDRDVKTFVRQCLRCQQAKIMRHTSPVSPISTPTDCFQSVHIDIDRGSQFESELFSKLSSIIGFHHMSTTSYHPQANGMIEHFHHSLKSALRVRQDNWFYSLPIVLLGYCMTPHVIKFSPFTAVTGTYMLCPSVAITKEYTPSSDDTTILCLIKEMQSINFQDLASSDCHTPPQPYVPHDLHSCSKVWVHVDRILKSLEAPYSGPYVIRHEPKYFILNLPQDETSVSIDRLKPAFLPVSPCPKTRLHIIPDIPSTPSTPPVPTSSTSDTSNVIPLSPIPPTADANDLGHLITSLPPSYCCSSIHNLYRQDC